MILIILLSKDQGWHWEYPDKGASSLTAGNACSYDLAIIRVIAHGVRASELYICKHVELIVHIEFTGTE
jgi:hypothetical protein